MWEKFKGDLAIYAASKVVFGVSSFLVVGLLTRAMDPSQYGAYTLLFAVITITTTVATSFLTNSVIRYVPLAAEEKRLRPFNYVLTQIAGVTVLISSLVCGAALWGTQALGLLALTPDMVAVGLVLSACSAAFQIYTIYCYSSRRRRLYSYLVVTQVLIFVIGAFLVPFVTLNPITTTVAFLTVSYAVPIVMYKMPYPRWTAGFDRRVKQTTVGFLKYGTPLIALNIVVQLNTYLDQFMLRAMRSAEEVGIYAANYVVADKVVYAISSLVALALGPLVFREWERRNELTAYQMIWKGVFVFVALSLPVVIVMLAFPDSVMSVLTAPEYADGRVIIPYVMVGAVLAGVSSIIAYVLSIHYRTVELAICFAASLATNGALNVLLIPTFGSLGCAFSTTTSSAVLLLVLLWRVSVFKGFLSQIAPGVVSMFRWGR